MEEGGRSLSLWTRRSSHDTYMGAFGRHGRHRYGRQVGTLFRRQAPIGVESGLQTQGGRCRLTRRYRGYVPPTFLPSLLEKNSSLFQQSLHQAFSKWRPMYPKRYVHTLNHSPSSLVLWVGMSGRVRGVEISRLNGGCRQTALRSTYTDS